MMTASAFQAAVLRGIAASPFQTTLESPLVLLKGTQRIELAGCVIKHDCANAPLDVTGVRPGHYLRVQIPKCILPDMPVFDLDKLEYDGRTYSIQPVRDQVAHAPTWAVEGYSPLK